MAVANKFQDEIDLLIKKIRLVSGNAKKDSISAFRIAAKPLIASAQARAPQSNEPHHRYLNGKKVATYYPGNLRRSIRALTFRRSSAVFVGPKLDKGGSGGIFKGNRTDGYYAHLVEFGSMGQTAQPFMRPTAIQVGPTALKIAVTELKKQVDKYANSIAI